mgnify:CR=1 FL=1|tara:strand:- start:2496 stop:2708 length:213 start_codon:yes stop_codon:yes gene_type:complete
MAGLFPDNKEDFDALLKAQNDMEKAMAISPYTSEKMIKDLEEYYDIKSKKKVGLVVEDVTPTLFNKENTN